MNAELSLANDILDIYCNFAASITMYDINQLIFCQKRQFNIKHRTNLYEY